MDNWSKAGEWFMPEEQARMDYDAWLNSLPFAQRTAIKGKQFVESIPDRPWYEQAQLAAMAPGPQQGLLGAVGDAGMYWNDPSSRTWGNVAQTLSGLLPGARTARGLDTASGLTKVTRPKLWRQLMTERARDAHGNSVPLGARKAWNRMHHEGTDYDDLVGGRGGTQVGGKRRMYTGQRGFDTGVDVATGLGQEALRFKRPQHAQAIVDWLREKAAVEGYELNQESLAQLLKQLGPGR